FLVLSLFFFFFQAEDGIRDRTVTGVQTCALPILLISLGARTGLFEAAAREPATNAKLAGRAGLHERYVHKWLAAMAAGGIFTYRSEERRVGKECRSRRSREH